MASSLSPTQAELLDAACQARRHGYAPYSKFAVGAAVRAADGTIFVGSNVENASYGLSICAERVALFKAISSGTRQVTQIAICTDGAQPFPPCGACRQVLAEFSKDAEIVMGTVSGNAEVTTIRELFPSPFSLMVLPPKG